MDNNITMLLSDKRPCASFNLGQFFSSHDGKRISRNLKIILFNNELWFATLGWMTLSGQENGFAGVRVREVACWGRRAQTGYPSWQNGGDYKDVTDCFWKRYWEKGMYSIPEVWNLHMPVKLTHAEAHTV